MRIHFCKHRLKRNVIALNVLHFITSCIIVASSWDLQGAGSFLAGATVAVYSWSMFQNNTGGLPGMKYKEFPEGRNPMARCILKI